MIDKKQVEHIAGLAKLKLKEEEIEAYSKQLSNVLGYIQKLEELDTSGIEPMITPSPVENVYRKDVVENELSIEDKLRNAPEKSGNLVKVPPVVNS